MTDLGNKTDLRIKKTYKALYDALLQMLTRKNFNDITVNDLCAEALVSRSAFYAHFHDKYDLLDYFLSEIKRTVVKDVYNYDELEREVNGFVSANKKLIANVMREASSETLALIREFMSSVFALSIKRSDQSAAGPRHTVLFQFSVGGLVNLLTWLVENNFPQEIGMMNVYLYKILEIVTTWDAEQEDVPT